MICCRLIIMLLMMTLITGCAYISLIEVGGWEITNTLEIGIEKTGG